MARFLVRSGGETSLQVHAGAPSPAVRRSLAGASRNEPSHLDEHDITHPDEAVGSRQASSKKRFVYAKGTEKGKKRLESVLCKVRE